MAAKLAAPREQQQQQQQDEEAAPQAYWGVVSIGDSTQPVQSSIVESWVEAEEMLNASRYQLRMFTTREDAEAFLEDPQAARWLGTEGTDQAPSPAAAAMAAAPVPLPQESYGGGAGGGRRNNLFGHREGPGPSPEPPTSAWIDRTLQELRPGLELDAVQRSVIDDVLLHKRNVFLTGSGGVGKSFVTKLLIDLLKEHYGAVDYSWRVCVTASTGIAATHVSGCTVHAAMGIGIPNCWTDFGKIYNMNRILKGRWSKHYEIVFIDEASMISGEMLDALDDIMRMVRENEEEVFGGIQLVFVGDLAQLSPIQEKLQRYNERDFLPKAEWTFSRHGEFDNMPVVFSQTSGRQEMLMSNRGMIVQSHAWWHADLKIVELTRVFRQKDADLIERLNRMRKGETTYGDIRWMNQEFYDRYQQHQQQQQAFLSTPPVPSPASAASAGSVEAADAQQQVPDPGPLHLYPTNADVDRRNEQKMQELPFPEKVFKAHDFVCHDRFGVFDRQHPMLALLESHERAGVELLLNNKLFYNRILAVDGLKLKVGAKVILLKNLDLVSDFRLVNGSVGTIIRWATGPEEVDFDSAPALTPGSMSPTKQRAEAQEHKETYVKKWLRDHPTDVPIVQFSNGRVKAIHPDTFSEAIVGVGETCRIQMPLRIAFGISIHKSQGMTLDQALVDVHKCFAGGQTYVAISRVGPREGLRFAQPLSLRHIKTEQTFLLWERLRVEMGQRKAAVLELLPPAERPNFESLGLKSLYDFAQGRLEAKDAEGQNVVQDLALRQRLAAFKNVLGKLKPAPIEPSDRAICHWHMLPWKKQQNGYGNGARRQSAASSFHSPPGSSVRNAFASRAGGRASYNS